MATRTTHDCDRCGTHDLGEWAALRVVVGSYVDVPSGKTEDDVQDVDLCLLCCKAEVKALTREMEPKRAKLWVERLATTKRGK